MIECSGHDEPALQTGGCFLAWCNNSLLNRQSLVLVLYWYVPSVACWFSPLLTLGMQGATRVFPAQTSIWLFSVFMRLLRRPKSSFLPPHQPSVHWPGCFWSQAHQPQTPLFPVQDPYRPFHSIHYQSLQEGLQPRQLEVKRHQGIHPCRHYISYTQGCQDHQECLLSRAQQGVNPDEVVAISVVSRAPS